MKSPRVISLVPSWTETLLEAGVNVVGRSRFCIHPAGAVASVPAVGGTKDLRVDLIRDLKPDLIILDREENTLAMSEALVAIAPLHVSHVQSASDMPRELRALEAAIVRAAGLAPTSAAGAGGSGGPTHQAEATIPDLVLETSGASDAVTVEPLVTLEHFAERFEKILSRVPLAFGDFALISDTLKSGSAETRQVVYAIWKDPWMAITKETYIGSMLEAVGVVGSRIWPVAAPTSAVASSPTGIAPTGTATTSAAAKYPSFNPKDLPAGSIVLLSSEPYPFHKKLESAKQDLAGHHVLVVDGESFSWFGIRSLRFLESLSK